MSRNGGGSADRGPRAKTATIATITLCLLVAWGCGGSHRVPDSVRATEPPESTPGTTAADPPEPDEVFHVVEPGQTLWRIARVYGVSLDELAKVNEISDVTQLEIGQMLLIPGASEKLHIEPYPAPLPGARGSAGGTSAAAIDSRFVWPVRGEILSYYGEPRRNRRHKGLDIRGKSGQPVSAAESGRVVYSGNTMRGYGSTVILDHGEGVQSLYAHNSRLLVRVGQKVRRGETIARVGRTGNATTDHVHFEIRRDKVPINPLPYLATGAKDGS